MQPVGKILVMLGALLMVVGLVFWLVGPRMDWFGRLPGDIRVEKPGFRFYTPLTTMLLLSVFLSLVLLAIRRFFG